MQQHQYYTYFIELLNMRFLDADLLTIKNSAFRTLGYFAFNHFKMTFRFQHKPKLYGPVQRNLEPDIKA